MRSRISTVLVMFALGGAALAADLPPDAVVAAFPFQTSNEPNRIMLNLAPDGSPPFQLMLDTGAEESVLTPLAARKLGVSVSRTKRDPYRHATRLGTDLQFYVDTRSSDTGAKTSWEYGLLGLKSGDTLMTESPDGGVRTPTQIIDAIRAGQRVRVARRMNDVWVDLDLPDDPLLQPQPGN